MEPKPGLIFKNISSLANLNSQTKFKLTLNFLHIKLLGKGIQERLYFNNIFKPIIKPIFLANSVIWKTKPNLEVIYDLGIAKYFQKNIYNK